MITQKKTQAFNITSPTTNSENHGDLSKQWVL